MCAMGVVFYTLATPMFALFCPEPEQRPVIDAGVRCCVDRVCDASGGELHHLHVCTASAGDTRVSGAVHVVWFPCDPHPAHIPADTADY